MLRPVWHKKKYINKTELIESLKMKKLYTIKLLSEYSYLKFSSFLYKTALYRSLHVYSLTFVWTQLATSPNYNVTNSIFIDTSIDQKRLQIHQQHLNAI